MPKNGLIW